MSKPFCEMTSKSTGQGCQQPQRWLESGPFRDERRVCQQHGRMLERQGWRFVRELHPVRGFERVVPVLSTEPAPAGRHPSPADGCSCTWCGGPAHEVRGDLLVMLYPGGLMCDACGRRAVACECREAR